jgi:gluconolactonase
MTRNIEGNGSLTRRTLLKGLGTVAGAVVLAPALGRAQAPSGPMAPPTTITTPPRDFGPRGAPTTYFTDPDVLSVDPLFNQYVVPNSAITRLWTGALWSEGPA